MNAIAPPVMMKVLVCWSIWNPDVLVPVVAVLVFVVVEVVLGFTVTMTSSHARLLSISEIMQV